MLQSRLTSRVNQAGTINENVVNVQRAVRTTWNVRLLWYFPFCVDCYLITKDFNSSARDIQRVRLDSMAVTPSLFLWKKALDPTHIWSIAYIHMYLWLPGIVGTQDHRAKTWPHLLAEDTPAWIVCFSLTSFYRGVCILYTYIPAEPGASGIHVWDDEIGDINKISPCDYRILKE